MYTYSAQQIQGVAKQRSAVMLLDTTDNMYIHLYLMSTTKFCHPSHLIPHCHIIQSLKIKVPAIEITRNCETYCQTRMCIEFTLHNVARTVCNDVH